MVVSEKGIHTPNNIDKYIKVFKDNTARALPVKIVYKEDEMGMLKDRTKTLTDIVCGLKIRLASSLRLAVSQELRTDSTDSRTPAHRPRYEGH